MHFLLFMSRTLPSVYKALEMAKNEQAGWPNGKALDYESRDCRFDPCVGHQFQFHWDFFLLFFSLFVRCIRKCRSILSTEPYLGTDYE